MVATESNTSVLAAFYPQAVARFARILGYVDDADWTRSTPCVDWDVRTLVAHVVDEHRWVAPLIAGKTIADIEPTLDADALTPDPASAWSRWSEESLAAIAGVTDLGQIVHLSFGDTPVGEYIAQLTADHLIHTWDLARAIGADEHMDGAQVGAVSAWFEPMEPLYRSAGAIAERVPVVEPASARTTLLSIFGRDDGAAAAAVSRFDEAFGRKDVDAVMAAMTSDCAFESTSPPDGVRADGHDAVRAVWEGFFGSSPAATFETEAMIVTGHHVTTRWRYSWPENGGGHVRGVDVFAVRDDLVSEKFSYVKG